MSTIKMFKGNEKPSLKKGEWASDGDYTYLGLENGNQKVFQGVFDTGVDQSIGGFQYYKDRGREYVMSERPPFAPPTWISTGSWTVGKAGILIPSGTPFSKLQNLFESLPRGIKHSTVKHGEVEREWMKLDSLDIYFEDGTYINDLGRPLEIRDVPFKIRLLADTSIFYDSDDTTIKVFFEDDERIKILNSNVFIARMKFSNSNFQGYLFAPRNSDLVLNNCILKKLTKGNQSYFDDDGHNNIDLYRVTLDLGNNEFSNINLFANVSTGTKVSVSDCKGINSFYQEYDIASIAGLLTGGIIIAGRNNNLRIKQTSGIFGAGGIEVQDGIIHNHNKNIPSIATLNQMIDDRIINFHT